MVLVFNIQNDTWKPSSLIDNFEVRQAHSPTFEPISSQRLPPLHRKFGYPDSASVFSMWGHGSKGSFDMNSRDVGGY